MLFCLRVPAIFIPHLSRDSRIFLLRTAFETFLVFYVQCIEQKKFAEIATYACIHWAIKRILKFYKIKKSEFIQRVTQIWDEFPQEKINSLVLSFKKRRKLVLAKNGESISEELRQGLKKLPGDDIQISNDTELLNFDDMIEMYDSETDDCPIQLQSKRLFSVGEDILLFNLV